MPNSLLFDTLIAAEPDICLMIYENYGAGRELVTMWGIFFGTK
jgi:hypothetical protein